MGVFDSVMVPCPDCGAEQEVQSKAGDPRMAVYRVGVDEIPAEVLASVAQQTDHLPLTCRTCSSMYCLRVQVIAASARYEIKDEDDEDDERLTLSTIVRMRMEDDDHE